VLGLGRQVRRSTRGSASRQLAFAPSAASNGSGRRRGATQSNLVVGALRDTGGTRELLDGAREFLAVPE
jgi:hypothetical protein